MTEATDERRQLAAFRARHAGDPPPPIDDEPKDYGIHFVSGGRAGYLPVRDMPRRAWRGTKDAATQLAERMQRVAERAGQVSTYRAVRMGGES